MKIVSIECPNCHATIETNAELGSAKCNFCGSNVYIQDENETKAERVIKTLGNEAKKIREYYDSDEYLEKKERINNETKEKQKSTLKMFFYLIGGYILFMLVIKLLFF